MKFNIQKEESSIIKVIGVGGGGSNAVNHMFSQGIVGVDFAICNTDNQAMDGSPVPYKIQLGPNLTEGRGAGSKPMVGKEACLESIDEIRSFLGDNTKMLFVTAGMGGGTGTGAAPQIAKVAQEMDILTVGIVTLPFRFEGRARKKHADEGLEDFKKNVDTLIIISNDKLRQIYGNLKVSDAFSKADNVLTTAAKGIAEIITVAGYVNVDFEDVNTVMRGSGVAIMGTAVCEGENRAKNAVDEALSSPLLEDNNISGAQHVLLNICSGNREVTMDEIFEITEFIQEEAGQSSNLIWGNCHDESLGDGIAVTVIATGFDNAKEAPVKREVNEKVYVSLEDEEKKPVEDANNVFEFDMPIKEHSYQSRTNEPYIREEAEPVVRKKMDETSRSKLKFLSSDLDDPKSIAELENQPAYMRKGVALDDVMPSSKSPMSKWSIQENGDPILEKGSPFFEDNVD